MVPRIAFGLVVVLLTSGCPLLDDASRLAGRFRSSKNAITGLDEGVAALKNKTQIFDNAIPPSQVTDDAVRDLAASNRSQAGTLTRWADDTSSVLVQEGEDAGRVTREVVQDVACDVMKYYIDAGDLPPVEMLAAYLVESYGEQYFLDPTNVAEDINAMVLSMQSGQSALTWLALQSVGCGF